MKVVLQRCRSARVSTGGQTIGSIGAGLVLLVGIARQDTMEDVQYMADKIAHLRIFEDERGKMNHSVLESGGKILSVSQFTLHADCRKGRRPSFTDAARPEQAQRLYDAFNDTLRDKGLAVETGKFGAMMEVELVNWGPVTIILDSAER